MKNALEEKTSLAIKSFTDLYTWKEGHVFVLMIYQITKSFPREEQFGLVNQLRRAAVSITSNIAEGFTRNSYREKLQFYATALGSLSEVQNQILIAKEVGYLNEEIFSATHAQSVTVHKLLNGLIKKTKGIIQNS